MSEHRAVRERQTCLTDNSPIDVTTNRHYYEGMVFEWDTDKNLANIRKHRIDFVDVPEVFNGPLIINLDTRHNYREDRWIAVGLLRQSVVVVVYVERAENVVRIISARKAQRHEKENFRKTLGN